MGRWGLVHRGVAAVFVVLPVGAVVVVIGRKTRKKPKLHITGKKTRKNEKETLKQHQPIPRTNESATKDKNQQSKTKF